MDGGGRTDLRDTGPVLLRESARYWWVMVVAGVSWLLIAWLVLRADVGSLAAVGVLLGCVLLVAGVDEAGLAAMVGGGWRVLHYVVAALFVLAALCAFLRPIDTFFALASVLGLVLFAAGAFEIARGVWPRAGRTRTGGSAWSAGCSCCCSRCGPPAPTRRPPSPAAPS